MGHYNITFARGDFTLHITNIGESNQLAYVPLFFRSFLCLFVLFNSVK